MKILTEPDSYAQSSSQGTVWGTIWIEIEGTSFPEVRWSDMVLAVLRGWLEGIDNLITKDVDQERLFFMDGPFEIRILKKDSDIWKLVLFKRESGTVFESSELSAQDVATAVLDVSLQAIKICKDRGIQSRDLSILIDLVAKEKGEKD